MMDRIPKYALPVRVHLSGEPHAILGVAYVRQEQRVIDMLCDNRGFFPVRTRDGVVIVNKALVTRMVLLGHEDVQKAPEMFPEIDAAALKPASP